MKKSFIILSIALAISGSIEAKKSNPKKPKPTTEEQKQIMQALHPYGKNNTHNYVPTSKNAPLDTSLTLGTSTLHIPFTLDTPFKPEVQTLIKQVDVNFKDSNYYNNTPLNSAAQFGANKKLSFLLKNGAKPSLTIQNIEGLTPLGNAATNGNYKTAKLILQWSKTHGTKGKNDPATLLNIKDHYTGGSLTPLERAQYVMKNDWDKKFRTRQDYQKTIKVLQSYPK